MIVKIKCINCNKILCQVRVSEENRRKATKFKKHHLKCMKNVSCNNLHRYYESL